MTKYAVVGLVALGISLLTLGYTISEQRYRTGYMQGTVDGIRMAFDRVAER